MWLHTVSAPFPQGLQQKQVNGSGYISLHDMWSRFWRTRHGNV